MSAATLARARNTVIRPPWRGILSVLEAHAMRRVAAAIIAATLSGSIALRADARRWWSHVEALANDGMEGRDTGSPGHRRAADYVAAQFKQAGLSPAGTQEYVQPVAFKTRTIDESRSSLTLVTSGHAEALRLGEDANISLRADAAPSLDAPLVFVGYGLRIPELKFDDLAGQTLAGAVAVYLTGSPAGVPGPLRAHYQSAGQRWAGLKPAGVVGTISIANPRSMD